MPHIFYTESVATFGELLVLISALPYQATGFGGVFVNMTLIGTYVLLANLLLVAFYGAFRVWASGGAALGVDVSPASRLGKMLFDQRLTVEHLMKNLGSRLASHLPKTGPIQELVSGPVEASLSIQPNSSLGAEASSPVKVVWI